MAGSGHSHLREFILGGAAQGMLRAMTVPLLWRTEHATFRDQLLATDPIVVVPSLARLFRRAPNIFFELNARLG